MFVERCGRRSRHKVLGLLGGSWVVISAVLSVRVISIVALLITTRITTHEPPSTGYRMEVVKSMPLFFLRAMRRPD